MTVTEALLAFSVAAGLLTLTPGLDTALVLRTAASEGPRPAVLAAVGICVGTLGWGAGYLVWLGVGMILKPRSAFQVANGDAAPRGGASWLWKGMLNNLLNPKAGVFYVSFLPQFIPAGVPVAPFAILLAALHCCMGLAYFAMLIAATRPIANALQKAAVVRWLDRLTGGVFVGFGVRLALERR